jgi:hypothetical protein
LGSLVAGPFSPKAASPTAHFRFGPLYIGRPVVTWGDSPHFLLVVNSLIEDADFDLTNNHAQVSAGDWDAGTRFRGTRFGGHVEEDQSGRRLSKHPPFLPMLLAALVWPLAGTEWVESACIWLTLAAVLWGLSRAAQLPQMTAGWLLVLGTGTPLWCYARDVWTEPWLAAVWMAFLASSSLPVLAALSVLGVWLKYPFIVLPAAFAAVDWFQNRRRRAVIIMGSACLGLLTAFLFIQYLFSEVDHFSLFHTGAAKSGVVPRFGVPFSGLPGLLLSPENGILPFFPFLAWGFWSFRKGGPIYLSALSFFLLHACFSGWKAGAGFSARYLVPILVVLILAVIQARPRGRVFKMALAYALCWGILAGLLPRAVYDQTPVGAATQLVAEIRQWLSG